MKRGRTIVVGLLVFFCVGFAFLFALILLIPRLVDHPAINTKVRGEVSKLIGGEFDFKRVDLSLFPAIHAVLERPKINIPQHVTASAQFIEIYPDILSLLYGKLILKKALILQPQLVFQVSKSPPENKESANSFEINRLVSMAADSLSWLPKSIIPVEDGNISRGRASLVDDENTVFVLYDIDVALRNNSNNLTLGVTAASSVAERITVSASVNTEQRKGRAHMELKQLQIGNIYKALLPENALEIEDGVTDVLVEVTMDDAESITMEFDLSKPHLRMTRAGQTADIKTRGFTGKLLFKKNSATLTLSELILDNPAMHLSGSFMISRENPALRLQLEGRNIDIKSARDVAIAMAGNNGAVRTLFGIVQDGSIPLLTVTDRGRVPDDLGDLDHLAMQATIIGGDIIIPGANLEMTTVESTVTLAQGILAAENFQSIVGNSLVHNGMFKLDLKEDPLPLQIETEVNADLAAIPEILKRFIDNEDAKKELDMIEDIQGRAKGKLRLDGDTDKFKVGVSASDIQFSARYHNIPYPITIVDGNLSYDGESITWEQLKGSLGKSSFATFSGDLDLGKTSQLTIGSGSSEIFLSELLPWMSSLESMKGLSQYYGGGKSIVRLSTITFNGPLQDPHEWNFNIAGELEDLVIENLPQRAGPLKIASLRFNADPQTFRYSDGQLSMLDGLWTVSGVHRQYLAGIDKDISLTFSGRMGPQITSWFSENFHIPAWLKPRPLILTTSQFDYTNLDGRTISATLAVRDGPKLSSSMRFGADDEVVVEKLTIDDHASEAALSGNSKGQTLNMSFDGKIHESTLAQLFQERPHLKGWLEGKATVRMDLKNLYNVSLNGMLNGHNLHVPLTEYPPLTINALTVKGDQQAIRLEAADLSWNDMNFTLSGDIQPNKSSQSLWLDLDIGAGSVDLEHLMQSLRGKSSPQENKPADTSISLPLQGSIHFKAEQLRTGNFTVQPFHAEVGLQNNAADITLKETDLCGISMPGIISVLPNNLQFSIQPEAREQQVNATLNCFANQNYKADGTFDIKGSVEGGGRVNDLLKTSSGHFDLSIANGHIYRDIILLNVVRFLNVNQFLMDRITPEQMTEKGLAFTRFQAQTTLEDGKLRYEEIFFDSDEMTITGAGAIDLLQDRIDFTLLVAPHKTIDTFLSWIPLIGDIFRTMATIPLSVKGTFDDVRVLPLAPSAIGYELQEIMKKTLGAPMKLIQIDMSPGSVESGRK